VTFRIHDGFNANPDPALYLTSDPDPVPGLAIKLKAELLYFFSSFSVCEVSERFQKSKTKKFDAVVSKDKKVYFVYFIAAGSGVKKAIPMLFHANPKYPK
jgi:hypothetical protein